MSEPFNATSHVYRASDVVAGRAVTVECLSRLVAGEWRVGDVGARDMDSGNDVTEALTPEQEETHYDAAVADLYATRGNCVWG